MRYIVICLDDTADYIAATHQLFTAEAAGRYVRTVSPDRTPRIITAEEYMRLIERFRDGD